MNQNTEYFKQAELALASYAKNLSSGEITGTRYLIAERYFINTTHP